MPSSFPLSCSSLTLSLFFALSATTTRSPSNGDFFSGDDAAPPPSPRRVFSLNVSLSGSFFIPPSPFWVCACHYLFSDLNLSRSLSMSTTTVAPALLALFLFFFFLSSLPSFSHSLSLLLFSDLGRECW
ncbi:uncharacterized protein DS421_20g676450 [Arachis hypogaea]|nr:uncharacterized protein DS421_20g676450 [Arachis hypogaea]